MTIKVTKPNSFLHWYHWVVISASLILTITAWKISDNQIQEKRSELFKIQSEQLLAQISERMSHYEVALKAGAAAIQTFAPKTQVNDWKVFSKRLNLTDTYPGINGIGVIYFVPDNNISQFIEHQRKYRPNFNVHPKHDEQEYWPITYIEPLKGNEKAVGLDMAFEYNRFSAAKKARDSATTQITAPIVLVQDAKKTPGFLKYIPFYNSSNISTAEQRQTHFVGHVYAPFIMHKLMEGTLMQSNRQLAFSIFDGDSNLYDELTPDNEHFDSKPLFQKTVTIDMYGRPWTFNIQTALSFKTSTHSSQPLIILGGGIVIDAMLVFIFLMLARSQKEAVTLANTINQRLSVKDKYYKHIIESAPCGMIITNVDGVIETVNPQTELLFGYKSEELIGNKIDMLLPKRFQKQHPQHRDSFNNSPSNRQMGLNREVFGLTKTEHEFPAEIGLAQFKSGDDIKTLATVIDMSEHVKMSKELDEIAQAIIIQERYFKHIIESAPCGMIITNIDGVIETVNPQIELLFGYKSEELIGNKVDMLIPKRYQKQHPQHRNSFNKSPSNRQMGLNREVFGLTKTENEFPAEIGLAQFKSGNDLKTLATIIDMTEHIQITEELKRSNRELSDFAYVASHDLKAPLRGIMQLSSWIEEDIADFADDDTKNNLALLMNRTSRLESLLEDLLAYSRIGRKIGDVQVVNIRELVLNIFDLQNPSNEISITCDNSLPEIKTYLVPLETIFRNLIGNSIKHNNNKSKLAINISAIEHSTFYEFSVEDNGSGIPKQHHKQIFELFKTLKPRDEVEGSGMGLSIIKKLLDYQNCKISVVSDGKSGTCFTFTWPK